MYATHSRQGECPEFQVQDLGMWSHRCSSSQQRALKLVVEQQGGASRWAIFFSKGYWWPTVTIPLGESSHCFEVHSFVADANKAASTCWKRRRSSSNWKPFSSPSYPSWVFDIWKQHAKVFYVLLKPWYPGKYQDTSSKISASPNSFDPSRNPGPSTFIFSPSWGSARHQPAPRGWQPSPDWNRAAGSRLLACPDTLQFLQQ